MNPLKTQTLFMLLALLTGCMNFNDEVWLEADGSGKYSSTTDMSEMYGFLMMMQDSKSPEQDSVQAVEEDAFEKMLNSLVEQEEVDTLIQLQTLLEEELSKSGLSMEMLMDSLQNVELAKMEGVTPEEEQAMLNAFKGIPEMQLRIQVSKAQQSMKMTQIQSFENINELSLLLEMSQKIQDRPSDDGGNAMDPTQSPAAKELSEKLYSGQTVYALDGNKLHISREGIDLSDLSEEAKEQLPMFQMMLGNEPYRLRLHLPRPIKSISAKNVKKEDDRTIYVEVPQSELFKAGTPIDVTVEFEL